MNSSAATAGWPQRLRHWGHRLTGGSLVLVGSLQELKTVDFTTLFPGEAGKIAAILGMVIVAFEVLGMIQIEEPAT